jgi:hypothetical protein
MSAPLPRLAWLNPLLTGSARFFFACPDWVPRPLRLLPCTLCTLVVRVAVWRSK